MKKVNYLKLGGVLAVMAIAGVNVMNASLETENDFSVFELKDAQAATCYSEEDKTCVTYTSDGLRHETSNARN